MMMVIGDESELSELSLFKKLIECLWENPILYLPYGCIFILIVRQYLCTRQKRQPVALQPLFYIAPDAKI